VPDLARVVSLACHDLRSPLATITGFAKTLLRTESLDERGTRYLEMIDAAADQIARLLDELGLLARIEDGRYEPALVEADTLELARSADERVEVAGTGATIRTDERAVQRSLGALAVAAASHGGVERVTWRVSGRVLELEPVNAEAGPVVTGDTPRDFGSIVGRRVIEALGGSVVLDGETLRISL
jgi:signal transduction histidine kinase